MTYGNGCKPYPESIEDEDLKPYGWAPGDYLIRCRDCQRSSVDIIGTADKRAIRCRPCAEAAFEADRDAPPGSVEPASPAESIEAERDALRDELREARHEIDALRLRLQGAQQTIEHQAEQDAKARDELRVRLEDTKKDALARVKLKQQLDIAEQAIRRQEREIGFLRIHKGYLCEANLEMRDKITALDAENRELVRECDASMLSIAHERWVNSRLARRIRNQRVALRENWQIVDMRLRERAHYTKPEWFEKVIEQGKRIQALDAEVERLKANPVPVRHVKPQPLRFEDGEPLMIDRAWVNSTGASISAAEHDLLETEYDAEYPRMRERDLPPARQHDLPETESERKAADARPMTEAEQERWREETARLHAEFGELLDDSDRARRLAADGNEERET